jgi:hypothetical protein
MAPVAEQAKALLFKAAAKAKPKFPWPLLIEFLNEALMADVKVKKTDLTDRAIGVTLAKIILAERGWNEYRAAWDPEMVAACKHYGINLNKLEKELAQ